MPSVETQKLVGKSKGKSKSKTSKEIQKEVQAAREVQIRRFKSLPDKYKHFQRTYSYQ